MTQNARADLSPITMEAGVLEYHIGSLSSLIQSSPRKESSNGMEFCDKHSSLHHTGGWARYTLPPLSDQTGVKDHLERGLCSHRQRRISSLSGYCVQWTASQKGCGSINSPDTWLSHRQVFVCPQYSRQGLNTVAPGERHNLTFSGI